MLDPTYLFLPGIFIIGIMTSYTDFTLGKIRNKMIMFGLVYAFSIYMLLILFWEGILNEYVLLQTVINFLFAAVLGYLMWDVGLWTAGDGKLFTAFAALVPVFLYNEASYVPFFPAMNILINTFVPAFIFLGINLFFKSSWSKKKNSMKNTFDPTQLFLLTLSLFSLSWIVELIIPMELMMNYFIGLFIMFLLVTFIENNLRFDIHKLMLGIAIIRLFFDRTYLSLAFWKFFLLISVFFVILRYFILELGFQQFTTSVPIADLKPGMVPAEVVYEEKNEVRKKKFLFFSFLEYINQDAITAKEKIAEGLSEKDVKRIKSLKKKHPKLEYFQVQQTLPFAIFVFVGTIFTLIAKGSIFIWLARLLGF